MILPIQNKLLCDLSISFKIIPLFCKATIRKGLTVLKDIFAVTQILNKGIQPYILSICYQYALCHRSSQTLTV